MCVKLFQRFSLASLLLLFLNVAFASVDEQQLSNDRQLFSRAVEYSLNGEWSSAENIYRDLMARYDDWPEPRNNLAILLFKTNRVNEAREMLEQAVTTTSSYRIAQNNRTRLYDYLASQAYNRALGVEQQKSLPEMQLIREIHQPVMVVEKTVEVIVEKTPVEAEQQATVALTEQSQPESSTEDATNIISQQLLGWSRAWSQGDVEHYLGNYSTRFEPDDVRKSYSEWKNIRRARLKFSRNVNVTIEDIRVFIEPQGSHALVEFIQNYQSASYSDKVLKQLYMHKDMNKWLILSERVIKTY